jgi:hypothetical protein
MATAAIDFPHEPRELTRIALSGGFVAMCPNGVRRNTQSFPTTQSPAAVVQDPNQPDKSTPIILAAGLAGQVRAYNIKGRQYWSFFASTTINAAVLVDESTNLFYVADQNGQVFAGEVANGALAPPSHFRRTDRSPPRWRWAATAPERASTSPTRPACSTRRPRHRRVRWTFRRTDRFSRHQRWRRACRRHHRVRQRRVRHHHWRPGARADRRARVRVRDDGLSGTLLWTFEAGASIGASSPSIYTDATVYIGRAGQQLASGTDACHGNDPNATCTRNIGGAAYAIGPGAALVPTPAVHAKRSSP